MILTRREFLKSIGAVAAGSLLFPGCSPPAPKEIPQKIRSEGLTSVIDSLYMQEISRFPLAGMESGIAVQILTDQPEELSFKSDDFNRLFNQIPEVINAMDLELFGNQERKEKFLEIHRDTADGDFSGFKLYIAVPANPHSCIADPDELKITVIPENLTFSDVCNTNARTLTQLNLSPNGNKISGSLILATGATDKNGIAIFTPSDGEFKLTANQAIASALFHEIMHILLSLHINAVQSEEEEEIEEAFVQKIEKVRLEMIREGNLEDVTPVQFISPESALRRLKTLFSRQKEYKMTTFLGQPVILS